MEFVFDKNENIVLFRMFLYRRNPAELTWCSGPRSCTVEKNYRRAVFKEISVFIRNYFLLLLYFRLNSTKEEPSLSMKKKILLVDDSVQIVQAFKTVLVEKGYNVKTAADGIEAIAMLHEFKPDVLMVDLIMPKLQGDKLCRLIRSREGLKDLFIIVLSAIAAEKEIDVKEFGGDVCIAKGPIQKMKPIVFDLLDRWEKNPAFSIEEKILGLEGVYRRSITSELLAGRHHASVVLNNISDGILELSGEGEILFVNPRAAFFLDQPEETLLTTPFLSWFPPSAAEELRNKMDVLPHLKQEEPMDTVVNLCNTDIVVNLVYLEDEFGPMFIALMKDISTYKKVETDLKAAIKDKDVLLKEVHHRVKNNLAMLASLISLEQSNMSNQKDIGVLDDLRSRISSISLVHDRLYRSSDMTLMDLGDFINELAENILALSREPQDRIRVVCDIPKIRVDVDMAIPLAIIVSELVTNALKYAFTDSFEKSMVNDPVISIRFCRSSDSTYILEVRDNGTGFTGTFTGSRNDTLGWKLVESLSTQVEGTVSYCNDNGAVVSITLPADMFTAPV